MPFAARRGRRTDDWLSCWCWRWCWQGGCVGGNVFRAGRTYKEQVQRTKPLPCHSRLVAYEVRVVVSPVGGGNDEGTQGTTTYVDDANGNIVALNWYYSYYFLYLQNNMLYAGVRNHFHLEIALHLTKKGQSQGRQRVCVRLVYGCV